MIKLKLLQQANLQDDHIQSVVISLLRGAAALQVAAAHLRALIYPGYSLADNPGMAFKALAFFTGFAQQAVIVFFLLSGWLVGGSLMNKIGQQNAIKHYAIDRITRLWMVLVPTFLLVLLFAIVTAKVNPMTTSSSLANEYSLAAFVGSLVGLQNLVVLPFGENFPLWSLANETWYYILFPLIVVATTSTSYRSRILAWAATAAIGYFLTLPILLYFTIWLMGAACSRMRIETSAGIRCAFLAVFLALAVYFRLKGANNNLGWRSLPQDLVFSLAFLLFLASMQFKWQHETRARRAIRRLGKVFADFSFTLYVIHIPLISMAIAVTPQLKAGARLAPNNSAHLALFVGIFLGIVAAAYLFHLPFEANTYRVRNWLKRILNFRKVPVPT
jgi:peptidoglycan/LPS O-acetylase OafA/YrhL